jgi:hypothetical protein
MRLRFHGVPPHLQPPGSPADAILYAFSSPMVPRAARMAGYPATRPPRRSPGSPKAAGPAGGRRLPSSAAARRTDSPSRCPSQSSSCAIARPAAGHARTRCWSARPPARGQRSTAPRTSSSAPGRVPPLSRPGSLAQAATTAPIRPPARERGVAGPTISARAATPAAAQISGGRGGSLGPKDRGIRRRRPSRKRLPQGGPERLLRTDYP